MSALNEFDLHRAQFFEMIGHCVTSYQFLEELLEETFAAALGGPPKRASAIFAVIRGLEAKLEIVSAALIGSDEQLVADWPSLRTRIKEAARERDVVAHARVTHNGGAIAVQIKEGFPEETKVLSRSEPQMELRKKRKKDEIVITIQQMCEQYVKCDKLYGHLLAFTIRLRGENPPAHLLEP